MIVISVYRVMGLVVVDLTQPGLSLDPSTVIHKPGVLATRTADLWDDCVGQQVAQIIHELLDAAPEYGWSVDELLD